MARLLWVAAVFLLIAGCRSSSQNAAMLDYGNVYNPPYTAEGVTNPLSGAREPPCSQFSSSYAMKCMERYEEQYGKAAYEKAFGIPRKLSQQPALLTNLMGCEKPLTAAEVRSIMVEVLQQYGAQQSGVVQVDGRRADGAPGPKPTPTPDNSGVRRTEGHRAGWDALQGFEPTPSRPPPSHGGRVGGGGPGQSPAND
jgi:hypothetical protein